MKILQVSPFFPPDRGGIAVHVSNIFKHLTKSGNTVSIVSPRRLRSTLPHKIGVERIACIYLPGWPYPTLRSVSIPIDMGIKIRSIIRNGAFDVVHVHGHHYPISWIALKAAHKYGVPTILTMHGMLALNPFAKGGESRTELWLNRNIFPRLLNGNAVVIGLTRQISDYATNIGGKSARYLTVPNGVDTILYEKSFDSKQRYRIKYELALDKIVILFTGRFEHVKGIIEFVDAAKSLVSQMDTKVEVLIVGAGTLENRIREIVGSVSAIRILDWQSEEVLPELYIASDIFVLPSQFEALPITVIEAMNAGLHIIYTNVGGVPNVLEGYEYKTLLRSTSSEDIRNTMIDVIRNRSVYGNKDTPSLRYARSFDWSNIASQLNRIYNSILS